MIYVAADHAAALGRLRSMTPCSNSCGVRSFAGWPVGRTVILWYKRLYKMNWHTSSLGDLMCTTRTSGSRRVRTEADVIVDADTTPNILVFGLAPVCPLFVLSPLRRVRGSLYGTYIECESACMVAGRRAEHRPSDRTRQRLASIFKNEVHPIHADRVAVRRCASHRPSQHCPAAVLRRGRPRDT
jgi:hypothetical protein